MRYWHLFRVSYFKKRRTWIKTYTMLHVNLSKNTFTTRWSYFVDLAVLQPQIGNATHGLDISDKRIWNISKRVLSNLIIYHLLLNFFFKQYASRPISYQQRGTDNHKIRFLKLIIVQKIKRRYLIFISSLLQNVTQPISSIKKINTVHDRANWIGQTNYSCFPLIFINEETKKLWKAFLKLRYSDLKGRQ